MTLSCFSVKAEAAETSGWSQTPVVTQTELVVFGPELLRTTSADLILTLEDHV